MFGNSDFFNNSSKFGLLFIALFLGVVGCVPLDQRVAIPNDGRDDVRSLQLGIDRLSRSGGGVFQLDEGVYDLSRPLYLRDFVTLKGQGLKTVLTNERFNKLSNWSGTTIFAGNLAPATFTYNGGIGHQGRVIKIENKHKISVLNCIESELSGLSGSVIWFASVSAKLGRGGYARPVYNEMNLVVSVEGCELSLADPVTFPSTASVELYWYTDGVFAHENLEANKPIRNAGLSDLQLRSAAGQTLISSGCYTCEISNIRMGRSRRLLVVQGARNSKYHHISGDFSERGIEVTMFANGNLVENIRGHYVARDQLVARPAIRFGEYARNNIVRNIEFDLDDDDRLVRIVFHESEFNKVENVKINLNGENSQETIIGHEERLLKSITKLPAQTSVVNIQLCSGLQLIETYTCLNLR